ncbi:MAG: hypothetical protein RBT65_16675, partial [Methanolobus sp.]|nr:hypothetical protein [Methanolobus sp.]
MTELAKNLYCIQMRTGVEIWVEHERAVKLQNILSSISGSKFILFEEETINTADIVGIFKAGTMQDLTRRKNGQWLCDKGTWHQRGDKCTCVSKEEREYQQKKEQAIKNCGKCSNGW